VSLATEVVVDFVDRFNTLFIERMRRKVGLVSTEEGDADLIKQLFAAMQHAEADFTLTFRKLSLIAATPDQQAPLRELFAETTEIDNWLRDWQTRLARDPQSISERMETMRLANPEFIPRNHRVEAALDAASERGDLEPFRQLLGILQRPYEQQPAFADYALPPEPSDRVFKTFCGT
jgi:uncharacterized protein YdiU (UPF0061 family)